MKALVALVISSLLVAGSPKPMDYSQKQKGLSLVGGPPVVNADFKPMLDCNASHIMLIPFGWQQGIHHTEVHLSTGNKGYYWGESDEGLRVTTELAHQNGLSVMLKPHIWVVSTYQGEWRGMIEMQSEADWEAWFASYETFILHYAKLAEELDIELLSVGTELHLTATQRYRDWQKLIQSVRKVYSGKLIYSANWDAEYSDIKFWDELDYIGIQAYFPLSTKKNPSVENIIKGWKDHYNDIYQVYSRYGKPVVFTEIGYRSMSDAADRPWEWPESLDKNSIEVSLETQSNCYEAFYKTFWNEDWVAGAYMWNWYPKHSSAGGIDNYDFTPQNKPAQEVMAKWYGL